MLFTPHNSIHALKRVICALAILTTLPCAPAQTSLGTEISYTRSNMRINGALLNGTFDFQFKLFDAQNGGNLVGGPITRNGIAVNNGVLKAQLLDFGDDAFNGQARFIDVKARQGSNQFLAVGPRRAFVPVPYALALPGLFTQQNDISPNVIGGFAGNFAAEDVHGATIGGGGSTGNANSVTGNFATIGGGERNIVNDPNCTIGGGFANTASGSFSTIGGGDFNVVSNADATVGGGGGNTASGQFATVPGGFSNLAAANFSFAAGRRAKADANGAFVWADSTDADFSSGGTNTFNVRCSGGAVFNSSSNLATGVVLLAGGGSWDSFCDRNAKENFEEIDALDILRRVVAIPLTTWNYRAQDDSIRHIGPMAQDFHAAFGLGDSDKRISTIDADGVLFAAVQGLHEITIENAGEVHKALAEKDVQISAQARELQELRERLAEIEQQLRRLLND